MIPRKKFKKNNQQWLNVSHMCQKLGNFLNYCDQSGSQRNPVLEQHRLIVLKNLDKGYTIFFFPYTLASVIFQVLDTNYSCIQLSICLFSFFHPLDLESAILILLLNMQNWQLCAKRVKKLWGDNLGIFFRLMLQIKLCYHWKKILKNILCGFLVV